VGSPSDQLKEYREKRDFQNTNEPQGTAEFTPAERANQARFVVQQHDATRMHYDVRLEVGGVLKSWAVPQGPCTDPQVKRLAVMTEDHPLEYLDFEGVIPKGEYGAGPMIVWDQGIYTNIRGEKRKPFTMEESLEQGLVEIRMEGEKLKGAYALVRTKFKDAKNSWLMVKMKDRDAEPELDLVAEYPHSVKSGRTIAEVEALGSFPAALQTLDDEVRAKLIAAPFPGWQEPMLASPADKPFARPGWIYEPKLDGARAIVFRKGSQVQMLSRNKIIVTDQYPELVTALKQYGKGDFVADAEIVAFDGTRPDFAEMQKRMHVLKPTKELIAATPVFMYLFDVTYFDGYDTTRLTQLERKQLLKHIVEYKEPIRYTEHRVGDGVKFLEEACVQGFEGILAKDGNAPYERRRSKHWLKFKCVRQQEVIVGGYTDPQAGMRGFGALLAGYYDDDGKLQFAGGVGTGFSDELIRDLKSRMNALETKENPFAPDDMLPTEGVHWIEPKLVIQAGFGEWTKTNKMRHPRFIGLRNDKDPRDVVREKPVELPAELKFDGPPPPEQSSSTAQGAGNMKDTFRTVDGHKIKLSNLDKVLFPDGVTKGQVIDYYDRIAEYMIPHVEDRPLSMQRFPDGIQKQGFYHKEAPDYFPKYIKLVEVKVDDETNQMQAMANNRASLVYLAQMAAITLHPWTSRAKDLRKPDKIVFDLDPSTDDSWNVVLEGAYDLRAMLTEMGLASFVMATGSRGLHVSVPIKPEHDFDTVQLFSKAVCQSLEKRDKKFTTEFRKEKRRGRVFLDYLRNRYAQTSVAPYSLRAKPGATVAAPLDWEELKDDALRSDSFTVANIFARMESHGDPWMDFFNQAAPLPDFEKIAKVLAGDKQ
jgi:bifunctional non-homologous end joining protein LigD